MINSFRYSRVRGLRNADKATLLPTPSPNILVQSPVPWASVLPSPPGPLLRHPLSRPHRYHSSPASAFYCFPWGYHCPWSVGKSFWCLRGARVPDQHTHNLPFSIIYERHQRPLFSRAKTLSPDREASQEMLRDAMMILCPCGDLGKQHTHCKHST